ncbi:PQQ-dependent sugar dehydrogenase [Kribbella deserti]|uniref:PQQ-dependent sugar dehydrogenase n=1 Tax=Kribbella deserti TaxID=1926257 RepID=A0ABV6QV64_9ACTN
MSRRVFWGATVVAMALVVSGCSGDGEATPTPGGARTTTLTPETSSPPTTPGTTTSAPAGSKRAAKVVVAGTVATGLEVPWGLAFLPDKSALVAERDSGKVKRIAGSEVTEVGTVPEVDPSSEGGLLGLAVDPDFTGNPYVYAYYSTGNDNRIARFTWQDNRLSGARVILDGIPMAAVHNGGRMKFGPDGFLYVGTGDGREGENSQSDDSLAGKILRITRDGEPAPGNPRAGSPMFSKGHRNVQGLAFAGNQLYAAEFGQDRWDELNAIKPGANYGWPAAEGNENVDGMTNPIAQWTPDVASPSGIAFAQGNIFMAGLRGERLWVIPVDNEGRRTGEPVAYLTNQYGRLRTVEAAPDGSVWLTTSNTDGRADPRDGDDRILRLTVTQG